MFNNVKKITKDDYVVQQAIRDFKSWAEVTVKIFSERDDNKDFLRLYDVCVNDAINNFIKYKDFDQSLSGNKIKLVDIFMNDIRMFPNRNRVDNFYF